MDTSNRFHCCATCKHFRIEKLPSGRAYKCSRLGYETKPIYRFNCWDPKETVSRIIQSSNK